MTSEEIKRLREMLAECSCGPWTVDGNNATRSAGYAIGPLMDGGDGPLWVVADAYTAAEAEMIAAARDALPCLLDEITRLREELARAEAIRIEQAAKLKRHIAEIAELRDEFEGVAT